MAPANGPDVSGRRRHQGPRRQPTGRSGVRRAPGQLRGVARSGVGSQSAGALAQAPLTRPRSTGRSLRRKALHGTVIAEYTVTRSGQVTDIRIRRSTNPVFDDAVRAALRRCRFHPALNKGQPIPAIVVRNYRFRQTQ